MRDRDIETERGGGDEKPKHCDDETRGKEDFTFSSWKKKMSSVVVPMWKYKHWTIKTRAEGAQNQHYISFVYFETKITSKAKLHLFIGPMSVTIFSCELRQFCFPCAAATKSSPLVVGKASSSASSYVSLAFPTSSYFLSSFTATKFSFLIWENISHQKVNQTQNAGLNNSKLSK